MTPPYKENDLIIDLVSPLIAREKYITEYQKGKFTIVGVTIAVNDGYDKTMKTLAEWNNRFSQMNDELMQILCVEDINEAYRQGKMGIIFHFQNTAPLENRIELVKTYYALGVRVIQLTYNSKNAFGCGCEVEEDTGLTNLGRQLIDEMNDVGILLDLSHAGYKTALEAIEYSKKPVILSHSNAYALCPSDRNVPDALIEVIARKKGVIGINAFSPLITQNAPQATLSQLIDHIDYISQRIGMNYMSLGLDYYTGQWPYVSTEAAVKNYNSLISRGIWNSKNYPKPPHKYAQGIETPCTIYKLKQALIERGYKTKDISGIMGENLLRFFSEVWN